MFVFWSAMVSNGQQCKIHKFRRKHVSKHVSKHGEAFISFHLVSSRALMCQHCREITAPRRKDAADITGGVGGNSDAACCAKSCALFSCVGKSLVGKCWECWECWEMLEMLGMLGIMTWKFKVFNPSMPFYAHMSKLSWLPRLFRLSRLSHF